MTFAGSAREDAPPREAGLNFVFVTALNWKLSRRREIRRGNLLGKSIEPGELFG
jgi:hypothetical protein